MVGRITEGNVEYSLLCNFLMSTTMIHKNGFVLLRNLGEEGKVLPFY